MTEKEDYERKRISVITVTGGMIISVLAMVAGSWLGTAGTLYGAAFGSGFSAIGGTIYENMARKAHAKLKARKEQEEVERTTISPLMREKLMQNRKTFIARREQEILRQQHRDPWKTATVALGSLVLFALVTLATLFGVEKATGKTLHANVTNSKQYGTSFSYSTVPPPSPSPLPSSPVPSSSSASPSASPDAMPDASPDQAPTGGASSPDLTGTPTSSASATSSPSEQTAPAANAVPSSSSTTGLSDAGTTASPRK